MSFIWWNMPHNHRLLPRRTLHSSPSPSIPTCFQTISSNRRLYRFCNSNRWNIDRNKVSIIHFQIKFPEKKLSVQFEHNKFNKSTSTANIFSLWFYRAETTSWYGVFLLFQIWLFLRTQKLADNEKWIWKRK